jgi:hypothetical protein
MYQNGTAGFAKSPQIRLAPGLFLVNLISLNFW